MKTIQKMKIVALIPLRGGSKSIPYKNIQKLAGKPLAYWVCRAAKNSKYISEVYVSTEDSKIKKTIESLKLGIKIIDRPKELASDNSTTDSVMVHFQTKVSFDVLVTLQATSPFTTSEEIDEAIEMFLDKKYDSLLTGVKLKKFFWTIDGKPLNYDYMNRPMRQNFDGVVNENGAFYITRNKTLKKYRNRLSGKIGLYLMSPEKYIDIDKPEDWIEAEKMLKSMYKNEK
ncbi:MAG: acylneuraminate cytidylyltransferase family protein [Candidatus Paceibacterota bacterium]|jgi:N-acylneuraminate cytidylyltransferase